MTMDSHDYVQFVNDFLDLTSIGCHYSGFVSFHRHIQNRQRCLLALSSFPILLALVKEQFELVSLLP